MDKKTRTAFILNPHFSEIQLLEAIITDFGIKKYGQNSRLSLTQALNNFLLKETSAGNNVVLIIDEAQNLMPHVLEEVRLLSNLETEKEKLLQVVLVGQPELNDRLNLHELRQLRQRIMVNYHIGSLKQDELKSYIRHRLDVAGSANRIEFDDRALELIYAFSGGTPRLVNIVCDRALLAGFVAGTSKIDGEMIKICIGELKLHSGVNQGDETRPN